MKEGEILIQSFTKKETKRAGCKVGGSWYTCVEGAAAQIHAGALTPGTYYAKTNENEEVVDLELIQESKRSYGYKNSSPQTSGVMLKAEYWDNKDKRDLERVERDIEKDKWLSQQGVYHLAIESLGEGKKHKDYLKRAQEIYKSFKNNEVMK